MGNYIKIRTIETPKVHRINKDEKEFLGKSVSHKIYFHL